MRRGVRVVTGRGVKARKLLLGVVLLAGVLPLGAQGDGAELVAVEVIGGVSLNTDTIEYYLGVGEGDLYDPEQVAKGFRKLWDSGLVEDLRIEAETVEPGKIKLIVSVRERPRVTEWVFEGNKKLSTSSIKEKLDTAGIVIKRNVPLRTSEIQRYRQAIGEAYAKDGYASAIVDPVVSDAGPNQKRVTFRIDEGAKVRIGRIRYEGASVFSNWRLHRAMKKLKARSLIRPFGKKLIWSRESWGEDSENLKKLYMNHGYKDIIVGEPRVDLEARNPKGRTQKEKKFRMVVTIPVQEGQQFRMGALRLEGLTVFKPEPLMKLYESKPGKVYNHGKIEQGNEAVRNLYHSRGYIYAYTSQQLQARPDGSQVVDVAVSVIEGERFRLGRLEFSGNTKTQDKVLRREFRLFEGDWMDMAMFRRSIFKVNQLGYFKLKDDPVEFKFDEAAKLVNVTVKGEEVGRTDIQFGAGYSELDKLFGQFMFSTRNFMGRGETLSASASFGKRADLYSIGFSEPFFLDRRMVIGASIYKQSYNIDERYSVFQQYYRDAKGLSLVWGVGLGYFSQLTFSYGWEDVKARYNLGRTFNAGEGPEIPHRPPIPPPYKDMPTPPLHFQIYKGVTSSLTPSFAMDSRDDPFDPNSGASFFSRLRWAGGPVLGGDFDYLRPEAGFSLFVPLRRRFVAALNVEAGYIHPYGGTEIPYYDRYRLGGERSLRGFAFLSVLPRKADGTYFYDVNGAALGGDRYFQLNLEYQIKLGGPLKFIFFFDAGNTWVEEQGWDFGNLRYGTGAELRVFLPIFQAPLRFIYGVNLDPFKDEKKSDFTFSIGTTF
ncbi:MAG: outer membrane protein assembly factor BamA [Thermoanaerobaculaceae bacterium]|nr:outer membrane protein assembly factor BamA [Thermoanaerobaculaceae bacterium]MDI9621534.1 outer membrane protein assembly factor BamA [Acidobacteriota bacterium]NLH11527.1 outer membrane protein assembly factor BamA [Holophagae bacterium]HPW55163.1 outer membrane protein assembly factor BamA [Thermoanaerobaculaceae bacterium]